MLNLQIVEDNRTDAESLLEMLEADMDMLFVAFHQLDMSMTKKHQGTGLGLHLSQKQARLLEGVNTAESEFGKGSHSHLTVPVMLGQGNRSCTVTGRNAMNQLEKQLLIIEDNKSSLELIQFILKANNFTVFRAADGLAGVNQAVALELDLILMEFQLPEIDGLEATRRIRRHTALRDIPIVAITSYAMQGDRERAMAAGCNGNIENPSTPAPL